MKIVLSTGGSAGHLFPALKVASVLKRHGHHVSFIGSFPMGQDEIEKMGVSCVNIKAKGVIGKGFFGTVHSLALMSRAFVRARAALNRQRPDAVIGFGGYGAFPVVLAAIIKRIPTLIHEQNVVPGQANRLLSKFVNKIAISFPESGQYFQKEKTSLTGYPIRIEQKSFKRGELLIALGLKNDRTTILVLGGSQGSRNINTQFIEAVTALDSKLNIQVLHICGPDDYAELQKRYSRLNMPYVLFKFYDRMEKAYAAADFVVARAGAGTVMEIAMFGLPAIFIPYPHAGNHQAHNARVLAGKSNAVVIEEKDLTKEKFVGILLQWVDKGLKEPVLDTAQNIYISDAAERIVGLAEKLER